MKVLYYNWTPTDRMSLGGGVALYVKNIFQYLEAHDSDITPVFLSSGYYYDDKKDTYLRKEEDWYGARNYSIVNSPVIAPLFREISFLGSAFKINSIISIFVNFIEQEGPFDVIHFQSFEGISPKVLELKKKYQKTVFVHSIHDYGIFCPNVKFWRIDNVNCFPLPEGHLCANCMKPHQGEYWDEAVAQRIAEIHHTKPIYKIPSIPVRIYRRVLRDIGKYINLKKRNYQNYREKSIAYINRFSDAEFCVSKRVAEIAHSEGINNNKLIVDYIGTRAADTSIGHCRTNPESKEFVILFMGYANKQKGFYSFIDALNLLEPNANIVIKIAARINSEEDKQSISELKAKFKEVIVYNGYSHADFTEIMDKVNIGVVCPLWEDNLPQVAIEMIANGIPVIASLHGGAHELNTHEAFVFTSSNDLSNKINNIFNNRSLLVDYWTHSKKLVTMENHIGNLVSIYKELLQNNIVL